METNDVSNPISQGNGSNGTVTKEELELLVKQIQNTFSTIKFDMLRLERILGIHDPYFRDIQIDHKHDTIKNIEERLTRIESKLGLDSHSE